MLDRSLSVFLPVRDVEESLARAVTDVLETLPELTGSFEVLIVDDGSLDDTADIAAELARRYPQVQAIRHPISLGRAKALATALENSAGDVIFVRDRACRLDLREVHRLWRCLEGYDVVIGQAGLNTVPRRAARWPQALTVLDPDASFQLLRRRVAARLGWPSVDGPALVAKLAENGYPWKIVEVRERREPATVHGAIARPHLKHARAANLASAY